jgi:predicted NBD/HSP70 family sugar kinase
MKPDVGVTDLLANRQVPDLVPEQVERFTIDTLRAKPTRSFNPQATLHQLRVGGEKTVVAVDIGGDKLIAWAYGLRDGRLLQLAELLVRRGDSGSGYLDGLEEVADFARRKMLPVGISFAGPTNGTKLLAGPNLPAFIAEIHDRHYGDFAHIFPAVAVANDAEAGLIASALEAARRYPETRNVIYVINGSGLGGAVLTDNMIFDAEPGHIQVESRLNPFGQRKPCGMGGATYVCVEVVAAGKAGIEDIWLQHQGRHLSGREISARYLAGDRMALDLYDNSALVTAHVIKGIARAFGFPENFDGTIVVGHGGVFHVPGFRDRVCSILRKDLSCVPTILFTKDFSTNTCLDGAAVVAVMSGHPEMAE